MAECHPVGFQWVMEAKARGAKVIHVDPRFTRTSALADIHVPLRAGTDIVFLGGVINYILTNEPGVPGVRRRVHERAVDPGERGLQGHRRPRRPVLRLRPGRRAYDPSSWPTRASWPSSASAGPAQGTVAAAISQAPAVRCLGRAPASGPTTTLQHPRCVFQILKRHFAATRPEMVERVCGMPPGRLPAGMPGAHGQLRPRAHRGARVLGRLDPAHGRRRSTSGPAAILQLLLGNIGRPGGGILALRGHASIQGSTDIPTLYNLLPGYLPMPHATATRTSTTTSDECAAVTTRASGGTPTRTWSACSRRTGATRRPPRTTSASTTCRGSRATTAPTRLSWTWSTGKVERLLPAGREPRCRVGATAALQRLGLAKLDWLVVRDLTMIESATFWKDGPEIETGELRTEDIAAPRCSSCPAARTWRRTGTFTNTQRTAAVAPPGGGAARAMQQSDLWFFYHLGRRLREKLAGSTDERDRPLLDLAWDYPTEGRRADPAPRRCWARSTGRPARPGEPVDGVHRLRADGIDRVRLLDLQRVLRRRGEPGRAPQAWPEQGRAAPEWGWAWPANRRLLYNRASADPQGRPWSERKAYVWWDAEQGEWTGHDVAGLREDQAARLPAARGRSRAGTRSRGDDPFIMQSDGKGWLFAPAGLATARCPRTTSRRSHRSQPALRASSPTRCARSTAAPDNPYAPGAAEPR